MGVTVQLTSIKSSKRSNTHMLNDSRQETAIPLEKAYRGLTVACDLRPCLCVSNAPWSSSNRPHLTSSFAVWDKVQHEAETDQIPPPAMFSLVHKQKVLFLNRRMS